MGGGAEKTKAGNHRTEKTTQHSRKAQKGHTAVQRSRRHKVAGGGHGGTTAVSMATTLIRVDLTTSYLSGNQI